MLLSGSGIEHIQNSPEIGLRLSVSAYFGTFDLEYSRFPATTQRFSLKDWISRLECWFPHRTPPLSFSP